jgi:hypothetical protein
MKIDVLRKQLKSRSRQGRCCPITDPAHLRDDSFVAGIGLSGRMSDTAPGRKARIELSGARDAEGTHPAEGGLETLGLRPAVWF